VSLLIVTQDWVFQTRVRTAVLKRFGENKAHSTYFAAAGLERCQCRRAAEQGMVGHLNLTSYTSAKGMWR
jgi:hypothetical protein